MKNLVVFIRGKSSKTLFCQNGFTLVETTIALITSTILLIVIFVIVSGSHQYILKERDEINLQQDLSLIDALLGTRIREATFCEHEIYNSYADYIASQPAQSIGSCLKLHFASGDSGLFYFENSSFKIQDTDLTVTDLVPNIVTSIEFTRANRSIRTKITLSLNGKSITWNGLHTFRSLSITSGYNLLFVVNDATSLTSQDNAKKALMQSWGYQVALISDHDTQANFDAALDTSHVVYATEEVLSTDLNTKVINATCGFVNEEMQLVDEYGFASIAGSYDSDGIDVTDTTHYITAALNTGSLQILSSSSELHTGEGTLGAGVEVLAEQISTNKAVLLVIEKCGVLYGGGDAAGRRVHLPWGRNGFDFDLLTADGKNLMKRSIDWAAGNN